MLIYLASCILLVLPPYILSISQCVLPDHLTSPILQRLYNSPVVHRAHWVVSSCSFVKTRYDESTTPKSSPPTVSAMTQVATVLWSFRFLTSSLAPALSVGLYLARVDRVAANCWWWRGKIHIVGRIDSGRVVTPNCLWWQWVSFIAFLPVSSLVRPRGDENFSAVVGRN